MRAKILLTFVRLATAFFDFNFNQGETSEIIVKAFSSKGHALRSRSCRLPMSAFWSAAIESMLPPVEKVPTTFGSWAAPKWPRARGGSCPHATRSFALIGSLDGVRVVALDPR
jgi:hypothetical protein